MIAIHTGPFAKLKICVVFALFEIIICTRSGLNIFIIGKYNSFTIGVPDDENRLLFKKKSLLAF